MAKSKPLNEYILVYAIFAHHRFKAVTVEARTKNEAIDTFYEGHSRRQYRIKTCLKVNSEDWEPSPDPEEIMAQFHAKKQY